MTAVQTVTTTFTSEYRVKGSKFLGFLSPASDEAETGKHLESIKKEHPTATHHCYAFLVNPNNPIEFSTDAGEPGGTAGLPILNTLKSFGLMNVILVVVRYYGGTKLGKSRLIDAYQTTAQQAIQAANLQQLIPIKIYLLKYDYSQQSLINKWKNNYALVELESSYREEVTLTLGCSEKQAARFEEILYSRQHLFKKVKFAESSFVVKN